MTLSNDELVRRADNVLSEGEPFFKELREVYKENIARQFEGGNPQQVVIEQIGAKLAVLSEFKSDVQQVLNDASAEIALEERDNE